MVTCQNLINYIAIPPFYIVRKERNTRVFCAGTGKIASRSRSKTDRISNDSKDRSNVAQAIRDGGGGVLDFKQNKLYCFAVATVCYDNLRGAGSNMIVPNNYCCVRLLQGSNDVQ